MMSNVKQLLSKFLLLIWRGRFSDTVKTNFPEKIPYEISTTDRDIYNMYRSRIVEEDRLVNDRMVWTILSQPMFLASFFAIETTKAPLFLKSIVFIILISGGLFISWLGISSVRSSRDEIEWLVARYMYFHPDLYENQKILDLTGQNGRHHNGHSLSRDLPRMFLAFWFLLSIYAAVSLFFWSTIP